MFQAVLLALAGSFYPVGLLFVLRYLAATRGLYLATVFLVGGSIGCALVSIVELLLLHSLPFGRADHPGPSGAVYVILGAVLVIACVVLFGRRPRPARVAAESQTPANPSRVRAFLIGLLVYSPGVGLIAAVKALYDAQLSPVSTIVGLVLCIVIVLWMAEVPILATAISPRRSAPILRQAGQFVARNGRLISLVIGMLLGVYLIVDGIVIIAG